MEPVWDAFWVLHRSRPIGFTVGPIPLSEIKAFLELFPVRCGTEFFVRAINDLDRIYLANHNQKSDRSAGQARKRTRR
jgi:hypothetical protein